MVPALSRSPSPSFSVMRPTTRSLPTSIAQQMNQASRNASAEVSAGRSSGYGQPGLHTDRRVGLPPQGPSRIPGTYVSAAEARAPARTPAHSSRHFMSASIRGQAHLLEGIAAIDACKGTVAPVNAAGSSNRTGNATGAKPRTRIKWKLNKRNFRRLLKKSFYRREKLESARWTIKGYMEEDIQSAARILDLEASNRNLKARNRDLEATVDDINDECQAYQDKLTNLENMHQLDAEELRHKDHQILMLFDRLTGRDS
ncbi:hypothetical protein VC83_09387 [Pseudogymnoascus destructans]|uniref:Uncharacterized protein n=2 Tax=Pseudogymnoascus destructans TaxID=655981 RepID=L8G530_PSED2|nr:uncharacterized protein VC83_09387 [Pseudogymnoascus destructans]ELR07061.1 hypothetical protein GMDG_08238 [Pseudogymnoascus destructans 20631-21]OAF54310.1 hypothetical protein VC83_09387 [Pseudogymnoascus destructans]